MEATKEETGLLSKIIPPRLEDAGLEDCALPPDSIKEAFFKAASTVKTLATSLFHEEDDHCEDDPWHKAKDVSDVVVGVSPPPETREPCGVSNGGGVVEEGEDKVVVVGNGDAAEGNDEVVVVDGDDIAAGKGGSGYVEGLKGLSIEEKEKKKKKKEKKECERPNLVEGFV